MSSARITSQCFVLLLLAGMAMADSATQACLRSPKCGAMALAWLLRGRHAGDPAKLFQRGQDALTQGRLDEAERDFRQVLQIDPQGGRSVRQSRCGLYAAKAMDEGSGNPAEGGASDAASRGHPAEHRPRLLPAE